MMDLVKIYTAGLKCKVDPANKKSCMKLLIESDNLEDSYH